MRQKSLLTLLGIVLCSFAIGCTMTKPMATHAPAHRSLIDQLCRATGMKRSSVILLVQRWNGEGGYNLFAKLEVDGEPRPYVISVGDEGKISRFMPEDIRFMTEANFPRNGIERYSRTFGGQTSVIARVRRLLDWHLFGTPTVAFIRDGFLVRYTNPSLKRAGNLDPYVSFLISPRGTVFGAFLGS